MLFFPFPACSLSVGLIISFLAVVNPVAPSCCTVGFLLPTPSTAPLFVTSQRLLRVLCLPSAFTRCKALLAWPVSSACVTTGCVTLVQQCHVYFCSQMPHSLKFQRGAGFSKWLLGVLPLFPGHPHSTVLRPLCYVIHFFFFKFGVPELASQPYDRHPNFLPLSYTLSSKVFIIYP